ncbi:hypothetical protein BDZ91DRAFT_851657 [Kalaharituber pfeilii]|nr:hypothetical protein BDZ91DRAFT_851657 [Kalaharituber pfeilii]
MAAPIRAPLALMNASPSSSSQQATSAQVRKRKRQGSPTAIKTTSDALDSRFLRLVELLNGLDQLCALGSVEFEMPRRGMAGIEAPDHWLWLETPVDQLKGHTLEESLAILIDSGYVRIWLSKPFDAYPALFGLKIASICTVYASFVAGLDPLTFTRSTSTVPLFISISEKGISTQLELHSDTVDNVALYRSPLSNLDGKASQLLSLQNFLNCDIGVSGIQVLIGAVKRVTLKSGESRCKKDVGIVDETAEGVLSFWGTLSSSNIQWQALETILLLTNPKVKLWNNKPQITIGKSTLIEVEPDIKDAKWLRDYVQRTFRRPALKYEFPENGFDWDAKLTASTRVLYNLAEIDELSRRPYTGSLVGFLSVVLTDVKFSETCDFNEGCSSSESEKIFTNRGSVACTRCEKNDIAFRLNPRILGTITDETGCVNGSSLVVSDRAWHSLLGQDNEPIQRIDQKTLQDIEQRMHLTRVTLAFGWSPGLERLAIWDIM